MRKSTVNYHLYGRVISQSNKQGSTWSAAINRMVRTRQRDVEHITSRYKCHFLSLQTPFSPSMIAILMGRSLQVVDERSDGDELEPALFRKRCTVVPPCH